MPKVSKPERSTAAGAMLIGSMVLGGTAAALGDGHTSAVDMRWTETRHIQVEHGRIVSMSPDGSAIAVARPLGDASLGELCVLDVETLAERACADLSPLEAGLRLADVTWSPDSRWMALTELALEWFRDGDLWLMDVQTGALTNLLDDGFSGNLLGAGDAPPGTTITVAANPAFSPDGLKLAFSRSSIVDGQPAGNDIAILTLAGGEPRSLLSVSDAVVGVVHFGIRWAPDGSRLYYSLHQRAGDDPQNGVRVVEADGTGDRLLAGRWQQEGRAPAVLQVAADGRNLLVYDPSAFVYGPTGRPTWATVDAVDGTVTPLLPLDPGAPGHSFIGWAGFSPDGGALVTLRGPVEEAVVALRDVGGTDEYALDIDFGPEGERPAVGPIDVGMAPSWSTDGRLFLNGGWRLDSGLLLTIEGSAVSG